MILARLRMSAAGGHQEQQGQHQILSMIVRRTPMNNTRVIALTAAFVMASAGAEAFDESKYPDLKGQWERVGVPNWTPAGKPPLTPEYEAVYEANRADMRNGGAGNVPSQYCFSAGHADDDESLRSYGDRDHGRCYLHPD